MKNPVVVPLAINETSENLIQDTIVPVRKSQGFDFTSLTINEQDEIRYNTVSVSSDYDVLRNDRYIIATGTTQINLPAGEEGKVFTIKNYGTGTITVDGGDDYIDGSLTYSLPTQYDFVTIVFKDEWHIVSS